MTLALCVLAALSIGSLPVGLTSGGLRGRLAAAEQGSDAAIQLDPPVRLMAGDECIDAAAHIGHTGPVSADLDADGLPDLLVGCFSGNLLMFKNVGTRSEPKFADAGLLAAEGETVKIHNW